MDTFSVILLCSGILFSILGLAGLLYPLIPSPVTLFIGLLLIAWAEKFTYVGGYTITAMFLLTVIAHVLDFIAGAFGAKKFGAHKRAVLGALIGSVVGIFFGFVGIIVGPFIGAMAGQLSVKRDINEASVAGFGAWIGFITGLAVKLSIGLSLVGLFLIMRFAV